MFEDKLLREVPEATEEGVSKHFNVLLCTEGGRTGGHYRICVRMVPFCRGEEFQDSINMHLG